ncbi:MAG: phosphoribosylpyrophosphate synthetase [Chitinophagales bacterium]|nr:phosphoribosylpyrophosphate synthetase [Chitinophagales bacterium]
MVHYGNLTEAITDLRKKGYTLDYASKEHCIECEQDGHTLSPEKFVIDDAFRFEEDSDPENQSVLYAISSLDGKNKGLMINAYGIYADTLSNDMIGKLKILH